MPAHVQADIDAPMSAVWELISDFGGLMRWHPGLERCESIGSGVGAMRICYLRASSTQGSLWMKERLDHIDDESHVLEYSMQGGNPTEFVGAKARMTLSSLAARRTRLDWISGVHDAHENATAINSKLEAYYPLRIAHLKAALGLG